MQSHMLKTALRGTVRPSGVLKKTVVFSRTQLRMSSHSAETFEQFTARYVAFFNEAEDLFEVQRGLNNCFSHDLVPAPEIIEAAVRAARRHDSYATAARIFEGVGDKVENKTQYQMYLDELKDLRAELGESISVSRFTSCSLTTTYL